jgi:glycine/D-amino acid oxidase-like deaminating enzyme
LSQDPLLQQTQQSFKKRAMRLVLLPSAAAHRRVTPSYTSFLSLLFLVAVTFSPSFQFQVASSFSTKTSSKMATIKNIVVVGGGIQGVSVAYQLVQKSKSKAKANGDNNEKLKITILESKEPASAASGKGGGFMARSWGDGSPTQSLHHVSFDMYEDVAKQIGCTSYRKLPVISVSPEGGGGVSKATSNNNSQLKELIPSWLDGKSIGRISPMGYGDDTAQITPKEFVTKMLDATSNEGVSVVLGTCTGMETETIPTDDDNDDDSEMKVTGVRYQPRSGSGEEDEEDEENSEVEEQIIKADVVVISAGPWSCKAEDWFLKSNVQLPMEGVKSTSIVWKQPKQLEKDGGVDATALFCGEDDRYQTHCTYTCILHYTICLFLFLFCLLIPLFLSLSSSCPVPFRHISSFFSFLFCCYNYYII